MANKDDLFIGRSGVETSTIVRCVQIEGLLIPVTDVKRIDIRAAAQRRVLLLCDDGSSHEASGAEADAILRLFRPTRLENDAAAFSAPPPTSMSDPSVR